MSLKTGLIVLFIIYGIPLWRLRHTWRSTIYRTSGWKIDFMPWFGRDLAALFTDRYFVDDAERRMARRYRIYVGIYLALLIWIMVED